MRRRELRGRRRGERRKKPGGGGKEEKEADGKRGGLKECHANFW